jgi:hypothetical protein
VDNAKNMVGKIQQSATVERREEQLLANVSANRDETH